MNFSGNEARYDEVLGFLNLASMENLFKQVPQHLRYPEIDMENGLDEQDLEAHFLNLASKNTAIFPQNNFSGAGSYFHYIPSAVNYLSSLGQFSTSYTPYQAEVSQGTLQTLFEYQTYLAEISRMDVVNASHYDGATAFAEALKMMYQANRKNGNTLLVAGSLNPEYKEILSTYLRYTDAELIYSDFFDENFQLPDGLAAVSVLQPDYFGRVPDLTEFSQRVKDSGALLHVHADPILLSLITPPGLLGADVYTGEGQVLGNPVNFGGPYLGIFAVRQQLIRKMPGRIAGETLDEQGQRGFVLTLSTREQHIRREKATSNICTNQGLMAVRAGVYMALLGREGLQQVAKRCISNVHFLIDELSEIPGIKIPKRAALHFREVEIKTSFPLGKFLDQCLMQNIIPGVKTGENSLLISTTEIHNRNTLQALVELFRVGASQ